MTGSAAQTQAGLSLVFPLNWELLLYYLSFRAFSISDDGLVFFFFFEAAAVVFARGFSTRGLANLREAKHRAPKAHKYF